MGEKDEARYYSDKSTLENSGAKYINQFKEGTGKYPEQMQNNKHLVGINVLPENYERWAKEKNKDIIPAIKLIPSLKEEVWTLLLTHKKPEATELIVEHFLENNSVYTIRNDEKDEMWIYNEGIYIPNGQSFVKEKCDKILGVASTTNLCNQIIFKIETRTYINQEDFFKEEDKELVAVQNGILNVKTKELIPFNSDYRFFNKLPMKYIPGSKCENIIKFFESTLKDEEEINVIQELFGFLLYREYFLEKAFMFLGEGRNGKGKSIDLVKRFLGLENCSEISLEDLENDMYSIEEFFKKMANLSGDLSRSALKHTGTFKKLTGRDLVSGARKFKTRVNFENYAKMIFACNELPVTYDITLAFFNRWILIDFPYTFLTEKEMENIEDKTNIKLQDPNIIEKIATTEELEGLLVWALEGLERLIKNKSFSLSPSTEETKTHWLRKSDSFQGFIMDCLEESEDYIQKIDLKRAYTKYCKSHRLRISSDKVIKSLIETILGGSEERISIDEKQKYCWYGFKFKENYKNSYGCYGISGHMKKLKNPLTEKTLATITTPIIPIPIIEDKPISPFQKFEKNPTKPQFTPEEIKASGLSPETLREAGVIIPIKAEEKPTEPIQKPVLEDKPSEIDEKAEFKKKMGEFGF